MMIIILLYFALMFFMAFLAWKKGTARDSHYESGFYNLPFNPKQTIIAEKVDILYKDEEKTVVKITQCD